jgi:hypothetical protein
MSKEKHDLVYRKLRFKVESFFKQHEPFMPSRLQGQNFYRIYNEHLKPEHSIEELQVNADSIILMINRVSREEQKRQLDDAQRQEQEAIRKRAELAAQNEKPYDDLQSAIIYFKKRADEIRALDIDEQDQEMLLVRLDEKRALVLDELI